MENSNKFKAEVGYGPIKGKVDTEWYSEAYDLIKELNLQPKRIREEPKDLFRTKRDIEFYPPTEVYALVEAKNVSLTCTTEKVLSEGREIYVSKCTMEKAEPKIKTRF